MRSVDLDEWTQSQIDAMRLGGNGNARMYFRKHGFTDLYGSKVEKKYKSKAAQSYKAELAKLVDAEALKRGESSATTNEEDESSGVGNSLLANLDLLDKRNQQEEAKMKLEAIRSGSNGSGSMTGARVLEPKAKLASSLAGASKLQVKPTGNLGTLRKPTTESSSLLLRKKSSLSVSSKSKPRATKLSVNVSASGAAGSAEVEEDAFEDIEETRKSVAEAQAKAKQEAEDAALAKKLQEEMFINGTVSNSFDSQSQILKQPVVAVAPAVVVTAATLSSATSIPKRSTKDENLAKLKDMTSDFFSQM